MAALFAAAFASASPPPPSLPSTSFSSPSSSSFLAGRDGTRRRELLATTAASVLLQSLGARAADAQQQKEVDEYVQDEERAVRIFEEATASVVCLKDLRLAKGKSSSNMDDGSIDAEVDGTGSGFVWDRKGHIVTNYHVIAKFATDTTGLRQCKVFIQDTKGNAIAKEGKLIGFDQAYDLAVLKVEMEGSELRPAIIGTSNDLRVGQSCFAIGNPYGFEHTLTTGVISGIGREIPSPNGQSIRGALQTDAAINAGNSGGPLIDSYGHVIGVNTATFTRKGTGLSSGVNFAIPVDTAVRVVPYLIVYGTSTRDRF